MNPSETVRRLLDERGIDHYDHENGEPLRDLSEAGADPATSWRMGGANVCAVPNKQGTFDLWIDNCTPEQAVAATVGNRTDLSKRLREVTGLHAFAELFGFDWEDESDWDWHDVACAMADEVDATVGTAMTLDQAIEYAEKFMGDYAKVLLESTLYAERDEPTDQHAFDVAEQKEAQMARDLGEALVMVGVGTCHCTTPDNAWCFSCSSCGKSFPRDELHIAHNHGEINYCPNCGARIIEEETE